LWGLVPITNNSTEDLLATVPNNSKVYVKTEIGPIDWLISIFLSWTSIQTRTVKVAVEK
jgi:hypothetical protein